MKKKPNRAIGGGETYKSDGSVINEADILDAIKDSVEELLNVVPTIKTVLETNLTGGIPKYGWFDNQAPPMPSAAFALGEEALLEERFNTVGNQKPYEPVLTVPEGYIGVYTAEDLDNVRNNLSGHYIQMADIDLSGYENWIPLGVDWDHVFSGKYNGNGFKISNITIVMTEDLPYATEWGNEALFGICASADFMNIFLENVTIVGITGGAGALAGDLDYYSSAGGKLINCHATNVKITTPMNAGGLVSQCLGYDVEQCSARGVEIIVTDGFSGLLFSYTRDVNVDACFASGSIHVDSEDTSPVEIGGVGGIGLGCNYSNTYFLGEITGNYSNAGGFIGISEGAYGGYTISEITNCYSAVAISQTGENVGGFIGRTRQDWQDPEANPAVITSCYYDKEVSGQSDDDGRGEPKTTAEMKDKATYEDWDFENVWGVNSGFNNGYPFLSSIYEVLNTPYNVVTGFKDYVWNGEEWLEKVSEE